jgi:transcriptional regulator with XRE-family HTH domain
MGNKVKEIRQSKNLTQSQLAARTGGTLTQGDISKVETDYWTRTPPKMVREISKALDTPASELFPDLIVAKAD